MIWNGFILEVCVYFFEIIWLVGFIAATPLVPEKKTIHSNHLLLRNKILDESSWPSPSPRTCFPPPISIWKRKEEEEKRPYCPEIRVLCPRYLFRKCLSYSHKKIVKDAKEKKKKFTSPFQNVVSCGSHFFLIFPRELFLDNSDQKRKTQNFIWLLFFLLFWGILLFGRCLKGNYISYPHFVRVSLLFFLLLVFYFASNSPPDISHSVQLMSMVVWVSIQCDVMAGDWAFGHVARSFIFHVRKQKTN
jgi:hypothetical protein